MRVLLDTHILLWWLEDDARLKRRWRNRIADSKNDIVVSAASAYEVEFKANLGRLGWGAARLQHAVVAEGFAILAASWEHCAKAGSLPLSNRDPFDRIIAAQAVIDDLELATDDRKLLQLIA